MHDYKNQWNTKSFIAHANPKDMLYSVCENRFPHTYTFIRNTMP